MGCLENSTEAVDERVEVASIFNKAGASFVSGILSIPFAWSSGHSNERFWHITGGLDLAVVGFVMSMVTMNKAVR